MRSRVGFWLGLLAAAMLVPAHAQMLRPPAFVGGIPGKAQFQAIQMQRHQARTLLYREALEELRKNPAAADVAECKAGESAAEGRCLARPGLPAAAQVVAEPAAPTGRRFAVLVGNNAYAAPIPSLDTPIADITRIAEVLRSRFGFETRIVKDAGKAKIIETLNARNR